MTQEEKAKAYDEALKLMRDCVPDEDGLVHVRPSDIFRSLEESLDERIRKALLRFHASTIDLDGIKGKDILAWLEKLKVFAEHGDGLYHFGNNGFTYVGNPWDMSFLEKQGEQKEYIFKPIPRLLDMIEPSDRAKAYCQKLIDTLAKEGYNTDAKIVEEVLKGWNGEEVPMAVMDEQKPINKVQPKQEWKQENREELTEFENAMMHIGGSFFGENAGLDPNDTDTIKEQAALLLELAPKTEWSEEDEKMCQNILECLKNGWRKLPTDLLKYESWIKSIKQRR